MGKWKKKIEDRIDSLHKELESRTLVPGSSHYSYWRFPITDALEELRKEMKEIRSFLKIEVIRKPAERYLQKIKKGGQ